MHVHVQCKFEFVSFWRAHFQSKSKYVSVGLEGPVSVHVRICVLYLALSIFVLHLLCFVATLSDMLKLIVFRWSHVLCVIFVSFVWIFTLGKVAVFNARPNMSFYAGAVSIQVRICVVLEGPFSIYVRICVLHFVLIMSAFQFLLCVIATLSGMLKPLFVQVKPFIVSYVQSQFAYPCLDKL